MVEVICIAWFQVGEAFDQYTYSIKYILITFEGQVQKSLLSTSEYAMLRIICWKNLILEYLIRVEFALPSFYHEGLKKFFPGLASFLSFFFLIFIFSLFYFTILYWFWHTLTWIHHGCTCVPKHEPPSHLPPHNISLGHHRAPAPSMLYPVSDIDWRIDSYMIVYMLQCHSPKSSHPLLHFNISLRNM